MPTTKLGKYALICFASLVGLISVAGRGVMVGPVQETNSHNLFVIIPMTLAGLAGILAFVFGSLAFAKSKDRSSFFVVIASLLGVALTAYVVGEFFGLNF